MEEKYTKAIGRRKTANARVYLSPGSGKITINKKDVDEFFTVPELRIKVRQPLNELELSESYDVMANVSGGGIKGQAESVRLGIARALVKIDPENKPALKKEGYLVRDPRKVERKKPGQPKARKKFQFSKR
ncbi:MAG: 30S ribosomal protein S9 [Bacteroidota bacterium]|nr:30S ribosomal protein S9 [Bacteroidota bacterium]